MKNKKLALHNGFSTASLIFGVLSLLTCMLVVLVPFNSGLAITFAFLSRGDGRMSTEAKIGLVLAVLAIAAAAALSAAAFSLLSGMHVIDMPGPIGHPGGLLN